MKDNQLKPVHYLVKHEEIKHNQKNDCHPILTDCGEDQFSIRINDKGEDIHIKTIDSFSFQSIVSFESKYKRPTKNQAKSLLQQSTILNDTDVLSDEEERNQSQNMKNQDTNTLKEQTLAIQYPTKSEYCNQQVPLKLTGFSSGDKLYAFIRGFFGLKGLPNVLTKQMSTFFRSLIDKRSALVYIDDILLLADEKHEMFELIKELHKIATKENLKLTPEKSFYMLLKVKFLGHEIRNNTIKQILSKIEAIKRIPSPKEKKDF